MRVVLRREKIPAVSAKKQGNKVTFTISSTKSILDVDNISLQKKISQKLLLLVVVSGNNI